MKILAVEDDLNIQKLLKAIFDSENWSVQFTETGEEAVALAQANNYDVVVLDWMLKGEMNGLAVCKKVSGRCPILMLTSRSTSMDIVLALECGADDYLSKPFEAPVLVARMRALLRRSKILSDAQPAEVIKIGALEVHPEKFQVSLKGENVDLTTAEFKLLVAILRGRGSVLSRKALLEKIQEPGITVVDRIIDTHVYSIRKKLGLDANFIETIRGVGYRIKP